MFDTATRDGVSSAVAALASAVRDLDGLDPGGAGTDALLAAAATLEATATAAQVAQARVLAALDVVPPSRERADAPTAILDLSQVTPHELSAVLGCSVESARSRVQLARVLCADLPATTRAAAGGRLRWWQARRVADAVVAAGLGPDAVALVDARVAADADAGRVRSGFGARVDRHVLAADPALAESADAHAVSRRRVVVHPEQNGTAWVGASLPAEDARTVSRCLDELADTAVSRPYGLAAPGPVDERCIDQRRADALTGLARLVLDTLDGIPAAPVGQSTAVGAIAAAVASAAAVTASARPSRRRSRSRGEITVTVSAETLLGVSGAPADLAGHGPLTAAHARRIAAQGGLTWRRLLTDPVTGTLLDRGRTIRTAPAALAEHVHARHRGQCSRPECGHGATDLDHAAAWSPGDGTAGGRTAADNLHAVCRGCHTAKHSGWTVSIGPDGAATWRTPHHWSTTSGPPDLRPDDRAPLPRPTALEPSSAPHQSAELQQGTDPPPF